MTTTGSNADGSRKKMRYASVLILLLIWLETICPAAAQTRPSRPNVLLIMADDYRAETRLGLDPHPAGPLFSTPNLDNLAGESIVYDAAFSLSPSCGPSRASLLTGFSVDKLRYWSFVSTHWRTSGTARVSLPQYFKNQGYQTIALGKIFHWDDTYKDDATHSWHQTTYTYPYAGGEEKCLAPGEHFCTCNMKLNCVDENLAKEAINYLTISSRTPSQPFFMALGFRRPHMDWSMPRNWMDEQGISDVDIPLPMYRDMDPSAPPEAFYTCQPVIEAGDVDTLPQGPHLSDELTSKIRRYYWATVRFMDIQLGKVLRHLDSLPRLAEKTIVIFMSDHGWSLGEKGLWCKQALFDYASRVPLMFRIPWMPETAGTRVTKPVSLVDLFPTLVDLTGINPPEVMPCFNGLSLFSTTSTQRAGVISQFPRCDADPGTNPYSNACMNTKPGRFRAMGYSIRTQSYRYTEWRKWGGAADQADWSEGGLISVELYDHTGNNMSPKSMERHEIINIANKPAYLSIQNTLASQLRAAVLDSNWKSTCTLTDSPTSRPTTLKPTQTPTTLQPTKQPTKSSAPTKQATKSPTTTPTKQPSQATKSPTKVASTPIPTSATPAPTTKAPTTKSPTTPSETLPLHAEDLRAFQALYDSTNGESWSSCANSRFDPCNNAVNGCDLRNHFIVCELIDKKLRLTELHLSNSRMRGVLPDVIFELPMLHTVILSSKLPSENANKFKSTKCVQAPRCSLPEVTCSIENTEVALCDAVRPEDCRNLTRDVCKTNADVCKFFGGGYGCRPKNFCGFLTKKYVKKPNARQRKLGLQAGAPGCLGANNKARCAWRKGRCVLKASAKAASG